MAVLAVSRYLHCKINLLKGAVVTGGPASVLGRARIRSDLQAALPPSKCELFARLLPEHVVGEVKTFTAKLTHQKALRLAEGHVL
jgi:hypothetical protein